MLSSIVFVITLMIMAIITKDSSYAAVVLKAKAARPSNAAFTTIKVSWEIKSSKVSYVKMKYGRYQSRLGYTGKTKTLKLSKRVKSKTLKKLKKNNIYRFELRAYSKNGKLLKKRVVSKFTGIDPPLFDMEYAERRHDYIMFEPWYDGSTYSTTDPDLNMKPDYTVKRMELYRYNEDEGWKLLSEKVSPYTDFKDTDVEFGKYYKYRLQTFAVAKIGGKKVEMKSPYAYKTIRAANDTGYFTMSFSDVTPLSPSMSVIEVDINMDQYNDDTVFEFGKKSEKVKLYDGYYPINDLEITDYKLDDGEWTKAQGDVKVCANQKISLRMIPAGGAESVELPEKFFFLTKVSYGDASFERKCVMKNGARGHIAWYTFPEELEDM